MGLIQTSRQSAGGGGLTITGWENQEFVQATNFISGGVILALSQTPIDENGIDLDYNGQTKYITSNWSLTGNQITILFADPYVTDYDEPPVFHVRYPY